MFFSNQIDRIELTDHELLALYNHAIMPGSCQDGIIAVRIGEVSRNLVKLAQIDGQLIKQYLDKMCLQIAKYLDSTTETEDDLTPSEYHLALVKYILANIDPDKNLLFLTIIANDDLISEKDKNKILQAQSTDRQSGLIELIPPKEEAISYERTRQTP